MEADLPMVCRLNGGNLRDTGHSFEAGPMAALPEEFAFSKRLGRPQHSESCRYVARVVTVC